MTPKQKSGIEYCYIIVAVSGILLGLLFCYGFYLLVFSQPSQDFSDYTAECAEEKEMYNYTWMEENCYGELKTNGTVGIGFYDIEGLNITFKISTEEQDKRISKRYAVCPQDIDTYKICTKFKLCKTEIVQEEVCEGWNYSSVDETKCYDENEKRFCYNPFSSRTMYAKVIPDGFTACTELVKNGTHVDFIEHCENISNIGRNFPIGINFETGEIDYIEYPLIDFDEVKPLCYIKPVETQFCLPETYTADELKKLLGKNIYEFKYYVPAKENGIDNGSFVWEMS